jgi:protein TonB
MNADILDIIFDGRNKAYGAYELRKTYNRRITLAMTVMALICLLGFLGSILANSNEKDIPKIIITEVTLDDIRRETEPPVPKPIPPPRQEQPRVEITRFTPPQIVRDEDVQEPPPSQEKLDDTKVGNIDQEGKKDDGFLAPPVEEKTTTIIAIPQRQEVDYDAKFTKVEKEAKFPGGPEAWRRYLERNLNANAAQEDGAPVGNYTVKVQFIVDKGGGISEVTVVESPKACPSCAKEAVKIIQKGGRWEPAIQNGRKVIYQAVQLVTFQVAEE